MAPKRNAFFHFMQKRRPELEAEGQKFPGGWKEVADEVKEEWTKMDAKDRRRFEVAAKYSADCDNSEVKKDGPIDGKGNLVDIVKLAFPENLTSPEEIENNLAKSRYIGRGLFYQTLEGISGSLIGVKANEVRARNKLMIYYNKYLENQINEIFLKCENIADVTFILISFEKWCETDQLQCIPAEVALVAFSVRHGVIDQYGAIIDPGILPVGMALESSESADRLYLPTPPFDEECRNYQKIVRDIKDFAKKHTSSVNAPGYLFCRREHMPKIYKCLDWLCESIEIKNTFDVHPYEFLLIKISRCAITKTLLREGSITDPSELPRRLNSILYESTGDIGTDKYYSSISGKSHTSDSVLDSTVLPTITPQQSIDGTVSESEPIITRINCVLATEKQAGEMLNNLNWACLEFLCCFHHQNYPEVVLNCALGKLNRCAYQTVCQFMEDLDVVPVPGHNHPVTTFDKTNVETNKRHNLMYKWGLKSKKYANYITPPERQERRHEEIKSKVAKSLLNEQEREVDLEPQHVALLFRPKPALPEFIPIYPDKATVTCRIPRDVKVSLSSYRASPVASSSTNTTVYEDDFDDDGWSFQGD